MNQPNFPGPAQVSKEEHQYMVLHLWLRYQLNWNENAKELTTAMLNQDYNKVWHLMESLRSGLANIEPHVEALQKTQ